jgi:uncharacterized protein
MGILFAVVLFISYGVNGPLHPKGVQAADHTHAFDSYCNPFQYGASNVFESSRTIVRESMRIEDVVAGIALVLMLSTGLLLTRSGRNLKAMSYLLSQPVTTNNVSRDIVLPNSIIASVTLIGLIVASVGACFLYYPPTQEVRKEMVAINAEINGATASRLWENVAFLIPQQEDWGHKLLVGNYLRRTELTRFQKLKLKVYLSKLELLEHACEDRETVEADRWRGQSMRAFERFKGSLLEVR